jgi:RNA polymerase sigma-70 factor (ECF subfamily)
MNIEKATRRGQQALKDEEIVGRILAGDGSLFELIMRRYNQRLFRIVRALLGDDAATEEVVQQAYVNAYTHLDQFAGQASFATWLTRIAIHEAYASARRRKRTAEFPRAVETADRDLYEGDTMPSSTPDPERQAATAEVRHLLEAAIDSLRPAYRSVFVLREVEGLSTLETAATLGISEEAVKVRFHRSKALLRKELFDRAGLVAATAFPFLGARCDRMVRAVFARLGLPGPPESA